MTVRPAASPPVEPSPLLEPGPSATHSRATQSGATQSGATQSGVARTARRRSSVAGLILSLVAVATVAGLGGSWTDTGPGSWYDGLTKPDWTPPGWVFGVAWTLLYGTMAVAAWLVAGTRPADFPAHPHRSVALRRTLALSVYAVQLALNLGWTWLFFNRRLPGWALLEIVVLVAVTAVTVLAFARVRRLAAVLLVPYLGWLCFAATLNAAIVISN